YKIRFIPVAGVRGNGLKRLLLAPLMIVRSIIEAIKVIREEKPAVVLGMGGFASGPGGIAAWLLRKPIVLHEQNAIAGVTNRILAYFARQVLMAFPNTFASKHKAVMVGNPIRQQISDLATQELAVIGDRPLNVLILGGSLGAKALNENLPKLLGESTSADQINVWHQTGRGNKDAAETLYKTAMNSNSNCDIRVDEFIVDMTQAYQWADLVICRAGALTVAEVAAAGVAAVFVPFPFAVDDHQTLNAWWLADNDAAIIVQQDVLAQPDSVKQINDLLADRTQLQHMAVKARQVAILDATDKVAEYCRNAIL
ncbi:MAG: undecaprenyldiphospho-muramoylpentapeptide beta-N-acetylglucosaminyltransferase, partial [Psychrosphaera sp.]|nr:undecaprenyldiphospho-muramoylpentapeptide beta-N-acetylglucosaminyltransferase [Psychrosphaera sp.]